MSRRLLPAPPQSHAQVPALTPNTRLLIGKRKAVTSACKACRQRKCRCNGARPKCSSCLARGLECRYLTTPGETPGQAWKRQHDELQQKSNAYEELFRILATRNHEEATEILGMIRGGQSAQAILQHMQEADLLLQLRVVPDVSYQYSFPYSKDMPTFLIREGNQYLDSWLYKCHTCRELPYNDRHSSIKNPILYQIPYHAAVIVDPRLDAIKVKEWTSIIDDNALLNRLLQVYFLTEYTWYPAFQKDYFLDDMAAGCKQYCSPLLVNAVLASACHGYSRIANRAEFWNSQTLAYQFLAEARRLWELEAGNAQLTIIQATIVLSIVYDANGSDEIGKSYLTHAISAAHSMQLFSPPTQATGHTEYNARAITAWALFGLQAVHSFHVFKAPLLNMPPSIALPDTAQDSNCYGEFWLQYPSSQGPVPVNYGNTFTAISEFRVIVNDLAAVFFSQIERTPSATVDKIQGFCIRLDSWYQNLPADLTARYICFPWQLKLHLHYYNMVIYLLETLSMTSQHAFHDMYVQKTLDDAKIRFETLLRLYYVRHGYESYDLFMTHLLSFMGFMNIKALKLADTTEVESRRSTLVLAAKGLRDQSQSCYLAQLVFRVMKGSMGVEGQYLLKDIEDLSAVDEEKEKLMAEQVRSSWPIDVDWIDIEPDKQRLKNLIKTLNKL